jgi:hypothetical protein
MHRVRETSFPTSRQQARFMRAGNPAFPPVGLMPQWQRLWRTTTFATSQSVFRVVDGLSSLDRVRARLEVSVAAAVLRSGEIELLANCLGNLIDIFIEHQGA